MVSVIMSTYNEQMSYVQSALDSILRQSYSDIEFIVIIDNPANKAIYRLIMDMASKDKRIRVVRNEVNLGLAKSLNVGIGMAKGEYIARMDADDISMPNRLEREIEFLKSNNLDMVCSLVKKIDEDGNVWDTLPPHPQDPSFFPTLLPIQNVVVHPTVLMRTSSVRNLGGYRTFSSCQDYDLWLRMITSGYKIGIINEPLLKFRSRHDSISGSKHFCQILNEKIIRALYKERLENGKDNFTEESLHKYLESKGAFNTKKCAKENSCFSDYMLGLKDLKNGSKIKGIWNIVYSLNALTVRESILTSIKGKYAKKKFKNEYVV